MDPTSPPLVPQEIVATPPSFLHRLLIPLISHTRLFLFVGILVVIAITLSLVQKNLPFLQHSIEGKEFKLAESSPQDQEGQFSTIGQPTLVFTKKLGIQEKEISSYVHISPQPAGSWHLEKNGQVIYFSSDIIKQSSYANVLSFNTVYTVTVAKTLRAHDGKTLPKDIAITFRTKQNPQFDYSTSTKLLSMYPDAPIQVALSKTSQSASTIALPEHFTVAVVKATVEQLLEYFTFKQQDNFLYEFTKTQNNQQVMQFETETKITQNGYSSIPSLIIPTLHTTGIYHVTARNQYGQLDFFIAVSNHIAQAITDNNQFYVWTTDTNGNSLAGITAKLFSLKNSPKILAALTTDDKGTAVKNQGGFDVDMVVSQKNDDIAVTYTDSFFKRQADAAASYSIFSYSDRPVYRPQDKVHYKAIIRKDSQGALTVANNDFYIKLVAGYNQQDDTTGYQKVTTDENGTVTFDTKLAQNASLAGQQIILANKQGNKFSQIDSLPLIVESYRKPDMNISTFTNEKEYISSDEAHFTVTAQTLYGQPLTNTPFHYRVLVSSYTEVKDRNLENIQEQVSGYYGNGEELTSGDGVFDNHGKAIITFSTNLKSYENSEIATLEITPKIGASPSIGKIAKLIHRGEFAIFADNVTANTQDGIKGTIQALNHQNPRQPIPNQKVSVVLYNVKDYQHKEYVNGTAQDLTTEANGTVQLSIPSPATGSYELAIQATDARSNIVTARQPIYVGTKIYQTPVSDTLPEMTLKTDKDSYNPGETALISVSSNVSLKETISVVATNNGQTQYFYSPTLITSFTRQLVNGQTFNFSVPIPANQKRDMSVGVFSVSNKKVVFSTNILAVTTEKQKIATTLSFTPSVAKPGDTVTVHVTTKDAQQKPVATDTSLSVIDAAVLQIGQISGDVFNTFYGSSAYPSVQSYNSTTGIEEFGGGGGGGCFLEGTKIRMANGSLKNIESMTIGDKIKTRESDFSNTLITDNVTKTFKHTVNEYLTINGFLHVTPIHRIFVNNRWKQAKDIVLGDKLLDEYGNYITVTSIIGHKGQFNVYNLTTSPQHTFFADGVYVHNDKGGGPRQNFADTAFWNPHVHTDQNGKADISFKLPDNLTTYTAVVVSNTKDSQFGQATGEFIAKKDIVFTPTVPSFYYQGDTAVITGFLQNGSENDLLAKVKLTIDELGYSKEQAIAIPKGDYGQVAFTVPINTTKSSLTLLFNANSQGNNTQLDAVKLTKQILPKGAIISSWVGFDNSQDMTFTTPYPTLDFNTVDVTVTPHLASAFFNYSFGLYYEVSATTGKQLFSYSTLLANTKDGLLPPHLYPYARLKNQYREAIAALLEKRIYGANYSYWVDQQHTGSWPETTLWIYQALSKSNALHLLDDITNIPTILSQTKDYLVFYEKGQQPVQPYPIQPSPIYQTSDAREEQLLLLWVLGMEPKNAQYANDPDFIAVRALRDDKSALTVLKSKTLPSADDRYFWMTTEGDLAQFPALALVEKGNLRDADKALRGLSTAIGYSYNDPFTISIAIEHALQAHMLLEQPTYTVTLDNKVVFEKKQTEMVDYYGRTYSQRFSFSAQKSGDMHIAIHTDSSIPIYTTIVKNEYLALGKQPDIAIKGTQGKQLDNSIQRTYQDIETGKPVTEIAQGKTGIMNLSFRNPFFLKELYTKFPTSIASVTLEDALSPVFMYLDQTSGNSPQYQSVLQNIFSGVTQYLTGYMPVSSTSDQVVFFDGTIPEELAVNFPYILYNISGGTSYQPKTTAVFPVLGLTISEK